jgi:hypothetical protein
MIISDLITSKEIDLLEINDQNWCNCINGAITRENYNDNIKRVSFENSKIFEKPYMELDLQKDNYKKRLISSISSKDLKR